MVALEAKAYEGELAEAFASSSIVSEFEKIKARYTDISPISILQSIDKAVKIPRVSVTQLEPQKGIAKNKVG